MSEPSLFDPEPEPLSGPELKAIGMTVARDHANEDWKAVFAAAVRRFAATREPFTSEDIVNEVGLPRASGPNRNNAVGAMLSGSAQRGIIRKTGKRVLSKRAMSHSRELTQWVGVASDDPAPVAQPSRKELARAAFAAGHRAAWADLPRDATFDTWWESQ